MENIEEMKMNKAKSFNAASPVTLKSEPVKRNSFNVNDAVRSLDHALIRLKKSKLVNGECVTASSTPESPLSRANPNRFMEVCPSTNFGSNIDNASLISMNFSHYELVRNLSNSNCNSDGAFSSSTCNTRIIPPDSNAKDEHLERYFRSVEMWSRRHRDEGPSHEDLEQADK